LSIDISSLEDAVKVVYAADSWFSESANCVTIEARFRRVSQDYNRAFYGFEPTSELPAVIIVAAIQRNGFEGKVRREHTTTGEYDYFIPMAILCILQKADYDDCESAIITMIEKATDVAEEQIHSGADWGTGDGITVPDSIEDSYNVIPHGATHIGVGIVKFDIQKIGDIGGI